MLYTWNDKGQRLNIAEALKYFRKKVNMTQKELAFECNIPLVTYEEWENGISEPPIYVIKLLAKVLGLEIGDKLIDVQTPWLLANNYLEEDFEVGDNWIIAINAGGDISLFELENDSLWLELQEDPDTLWRDGDRVFRCAIATVRPTVKIKVLEEITYNNPLTE